MKNIISLIFIGLLALCSHVMAQTINATPEAAGTTATASAPKDEKTEAEVRKVDVAAGKLTLRHGEIKNLGMPPMTMVFQVKDPALLTRVKAGDRVNFTADKIKGAYTVLSIEVIQ